MQQHYEGVVEGRRERVESSPVPARSRNEGRPDKDGRGIGGTLKDEAVLVSKSHEDARLASVRTVRNHRDTSAEARDQAGGDVDARTTIGG